MPTVTILLAHPDLPASRAGRALVEAARSVPGVRVDDLYANYPDGRIDAGAEVASLLTTTHLVLQFPLQWYSTPPLLKAWQDAVLTRMVYARFDEEGARLRGRSLLVAVTAGASAADYDRGGRNRFSVAEILRPLEATAHRCGMVWLEPFVVHDARSADAATLERSGRAYAARLEGLRATARGAA